LIFKGVLIFSFYVLFFPEIGLGKSLKLISTLFSAFCFDYDLSQSFSFIFKNALSVSVLSFIYFSFKVLVSYIFYFFPIGAPQPLNTIFFLLYLFFEGLLSERDIF
jgi:hypothetical protein